MPIFAVLALSACGGGGSSIDINDRPVVTVSVQPANFGPGEPVELEAYVSDNDPIDYVDFYRIDAGGATLIGTEDFRPYIITTTVPNDGRYTFSVFAVATDIWGAQGTSPVVISGQ